MKRFILIAMLAIFGVMGYAQSMKMVVNAKGEVVGRFVSDNGSTYTIDVQDYYDVAKAGLHVVTFYASKGQGVVWSVRDGVVNVRKKPNTSSAVVAKIYNSGDLPDVFPCLGLVNGWYKIRIHGKIGYVRADLVEWDGMNTF